MRIHLRRATLYALTGTCAMFFLLVLQKNSQLTELENIIIDDSHEGMHPDDDYSDDKSGIEEHEESSKFGETFEGSMNIWFDKVNLWNDRIVAQMKYIPEAYKRSGNSTAVKYIYIPGGLWDTPMGQTKFLEQECPVNRCLLTAQSQFKEKADAVLIQNGLDGLRLVKQPGQIWILWVLESPLNTIGLDWLQKKINWTASFRSDSTIVTPYEKFVPFSNHSKFSLPLKMKKNYAEDKTKLAAWFVSNCNSMNKRLEYARQLKKYIPIDIFGACGTHKCERGQRGNECDQLLQSTYKFYLSFENSNCEYYITEKLFWNALLNNIVPVVMGARKQDYLSAAPPESFIHVEDFDSPKDLAEYLRKLDQDDSMYNTYFRWKQTGEFINTKFWCRMCAMLHDEEKPILWQENVETWWRHNGTCTKNIWTESDYITNWHEFTIDYS